MMDKLNRWWWTFACAFLKLTVKTFWGSERWCELEGFHRWDVVASEYNPATKEFANVDVWCMECGVFYNFTSWQSFAQWAVREIRSRG